MITERASFHKQLEKCEEMGGTLGYPETPKQHFDSSDFNIFSIKEFTFDESEVDSFYANGKPKEFGYDYIGALDKG